MKLSVISSAAILFLLAAIAISYGAMSEKQKIGALLDAVEKSNITFIRNGSEHKPAEARAHLERKLTKAGGEVKTAEDFIRYIASGSSMSGKPYLVRLGNGRVVSAADWLRARLREIEKRK